MFLISNSAKLTLCMELLYILCIRMLVHYTIYVKIDITFTTTIDLLVRNHRIIVLFFSTSIDYYISFGRTQLYYTKVLAIHWMLDLVTIKGGRGLVTDPFGSLSKSNQLSLVSNIYIWYRSDHCQITDKSALFW